MEHEIERKLSSGKGVWGLVVAGTTLALVLAGAGYEASKEQLDKIYATRECAVDTNLGNYPPTTDKAVLRELIGTCADANNAKIAPSVLEKMIEFVIQETYSRIVSP